MSARRTGLLLSVALATTTLGALAVAPSATAAGCGTVLSATRNGAETAPFVVDANCFANDGAQNVSWNVQGPDGYDLGAAAREDVYVITIDTGTTIPRVSDTKGTDVVVKRVKADDGHWHVTITATPVLATAECTTNKTPWICPEVATKQWDGYLGGQLTDYGTWEDRRQREAFFGMDYVSNIDAGAIPPQIVRDPASGADMIFLELANSHYLKMPATTVFKGEVSVVIPNAFLKEVYGVDNPASLTTSGLKPDITGKGSGTVSIVDTGGALRVDVTDLTFSQRNVKVHRGNIKPGKPGRLSADRKNASAVKLTYSAAKARGSKVKGYTATCVTKSGPKHVVTVHDKKPSTTVSGLHANTEYTCKVRARSKAGNGGWAKVGVARKP